jgi:hypothetical protein
MNADNLLTGAIGGLIGTVVSSVVSFLIFRRQANIESNRIFLQTLLFRIQKVYLSIQQNKEVDDGDIKYLISFQAIGFKDFRNLNDTLIELKIHIIQYNEGVRKTIESTTTSTLQVSSKSEVERRIVKVVEQIRKLT